MIQTGITQNLIPNILRVRRKAGKFSMPVSPEQFRYANFKHITGVSSGENSKGVSLSKLRVLDNLIEKLIGKKGQAKTIVNNSTKSVDQLITKLRSQVNVQSSPTSSLPFSKHLDKGIFLNIMA